MKPKIGRPKIPKSKVRGILIQARLSPAEDRVIRAAVQRSGSRKSEWIRETLLAAAGRGPRAE